MVRLRKGAAAEKGADKGRNGGKGEGRRGAGGGGYRQFRRIVFGATAPAGASPSAGTLWGLQREGLDDPLSLPSAHWAFMADRPSAGAAGTVMAPDKPHRSQNLQNGSRSAPTSCVISQTTHDGPCVSDTLAGNGTPGALVQTAVAASACA